jgi:DNA-binding MarR family transcriptional regulator
VLTAAGHALTERAVPEHLANEARLLEPLTAAEQATLARLLGRLGAALGV